jgi:PIN domain nuclease of toxin-antitoxin system
VSGWTYLLDTHAWVWYLASPEVLPGSLLQALEEAREREALLISAITPWEVAVLVRKGRIGFTLEPRVWLERTLGVGGIRVVPLDAATALEAAWLDLPHPDPADCFIVATALRTGAVLVTRDERLWAYPRVPNLWD